jgi:subtilisin-like proprotein convertase family protein
VPVAIPDDSGAGVTSTVFVSSRGRIKDINVRLPGTVASPGIEHNFVGDLVIDLIGPDGTTVRLAEHPGGPDNAGNDLVGTVFDDEASQTIGATGTAAPYTGQFKPQRDQLSRFDGKDRRGTWTLRVRDLFESDTGTLRAWGLSTQKAVCDFDTAAPDTRMLTEPANPTDDTSPTFTFDSPDDPGATFECKLDSADYEPCASPKTYAALAPGPRTFQVRAVDGSGNEDATAETVTWTIEDTVAPVVTLSQPANGSSTTDTTPTLAGVAGTQEGDDSTVTLKLWSGSLAAGLPAQTLIVPRDAASGAFSAIPVALAEGSYTVRAEQGDSALPSENIGVSGPVTFTVDIPETPPSGNGGAPAFAVAPLEEAMSEALANRYTVLAACNSACEVKATLGLSARSARRLGMRARPVTIGSGGKRLAKAGSAALKVGLSAAARRALRGRNGAGATLRIAVRGPEGPILTLDQTVRLRRESALKRVIGSGLRLGTACSRRCALRGELGLSATSARKLGMKPKSARRITIASGRARVGPSPRKLVLKVPPHVGQALRGARQVTALLEVSAGSGSTGQRRASRRLTLR